MKLTSAFTSIRTLTVIATAGLLTLSTAAAALRTYEAKWSGAIYGNNALAIARIVIDEDHLLNPGMQQNLFTDTNRAIVSIDMVVTGAPSGNGTFTTADYLGYNLRIAEELDLDADWHGQPQLSYPGWGMHPVDPVHLFSLFVESSAVPYSGSDYILHIGPSKASLFSFIPIIGEISLGESVVNVSNATVVAMSPPSVASDKSLYMRATLKGTDVSGTNNTCLLKWNRTHASVLVQEGDTLAGAPIAAIGDPVVEGANVFFLAKLLSGGSVTASNDQVLSRVSTTGSDLTVVAQEGTAAPEVSGFNYFKVLWIHPLTNGVFFGATIADSVNPKLKKTGIWFNNGTTTTLKAVIGGSVEFRGETKEIKILGRPTAASPVNMQTRVGNASQVVVMIKTTDNTTFLKEFKP